MSFENEWTDKQNGVDYILAEDINSIAHELIQLEKQSDTTSGIISLMDNDIAVLEKEMENTYTKEEVDKMITGVYRFCGSTTVFQNSIAAKAKRAGDVYHIATGGQVSQGADVLIPIQYLDGYTMYLDRTEYDNILAITASSEYTYIQLNTKKGYDTSPSAIITNIKITAIEDDYIEMTYEFDTNSSITDPSEIDISSLKLSYMDCSFTAENGDNVAWTGDYWDKL